MGKMGKKTQTLSTKLFIVGTINSKNRIRKISRQTGKKVLGNDERDEWKGKKNRVMKICLF